MDPYAIIRLGNKQHRVRDGEVLVVDRLPAAEGESFQPDVLLGVQGVTATVVAHERGPKIRIGKYRRRTGYKRHTGFRAATSRVRISLGAAGASTPARPVRAAKPRPEPARPEPAKPEPAAETPPAEPAEPAVEAVAAPPAEPAEAPAAFPEGYDELKVTEIKTAASGWSRAQVEAALAHEQAHAARKGAIAALEAALARADEGEA